MPERIESARVIPEVHRVTKNYGLTRISDEGSGVLRGGPRGAVPLGRRVSGAKIFNRWIYLFSKFSLFYIFQVEKRSVRANVALFLFFLPK